MAESVTLAKRLESIEQELQTLKKAIQEKPSSRARKKNVSLKGLWKGMKVTDEDIEEAKRSLFPNAR